EEIHQAKQVGVGPQQKEMRQAFPQTTQVGVGPQQREMYQVFQKDIIFDKYLNDVWQFKIKLKQI
ncbi:hypothetical protein HMPREF2693_07270, partial [Staphylococcus sp. HMSC068D08]|uniref:hypothetical protein n=1 Tax=Staphylococcus sp. HMSC068D08 TaxID=1715172 RepID=UPI0008A5B6DD